MQVTSEQLDPCKVQLTVELDADAVAKTIVEVYDEYAKHTSVPGFRKGKTPRAIVERYVSPESVKERAIEKMVGPAYYQAIEEKEIHPYAEPEVDIVQYEPGQPFIFKADIPLPPTVELGDYKGIEVERRKVEITDEDVEAQLKQLQDSRATTEKVEGRGVQENDIAIASIASAVDGEEMGEPRRSLIRLGTNVPGFDENIIGLKADEQKSFDITYPEDYSEADMAGKLVHFQVSIESIRERKVPEMNDEFAKTFGDFENVDALKAYIKKHLIKSAEEAADREVEQKIVDEIVNRSKICFPDIMLNHDVYHDIQDFQKRLSEQGMTVDNYLQQTGKTQEQFIEEVKEEASQRIRIGLVLGEIAESADLKVTDEDVEAEINRIAESSSVPRESVEEYLETKGGRATLQNSVLNKKIMDYIKSVSVIE